MYNKRVKRTTAFVAIIAAVAVGAGAVYGLKHKPAKTSDTETSSISSVQHSSTPTPQPAQFNKTQYSLDDPASIWVVVDKQRPLNPKSYTPNDLTGIGSGQYLRSAAASAYQALVNDAKTAGFTLVSESGYRSYDTQVSVYGNEVKNFGQATADTESARPGYSEHQTGWAVDIAAPGCIEDCFGGTAAYKWVLANAATYGFAQRYPADKSAITGYRHEPWHFRYVGPELANELSKTNQTLEEFFGLPAAPNY
jgi:D-alanyl-D-alanine carboxypeptidase